MVNMRFNINGKKGYFFILDSVVAVMIMTVAFMALYSDPVDTPQKERLDLMAGDIEVFLSNTRINELDSTEISIIGTYLSNGDITDKRNTIMQQVGEFYQLSEDPKASSLLDGVIGTIVPSQFNFEIYIENTLIYSRVMPGHSKDNSRVVIIKRGIVYGIDEDGFSLWGPYISEVRMWE
tara:strand:- start:22066 stop:22602 length:537 start_codon:yes stop_codon:yes gene_type:complete